MALERTHFVGKVIHVAEVAIDRRKPHVRHLIELLQLRHHERAQFASQDLALWTVVEDLLGAIGDLVDVRRFDGPLLAGLEQAGHELRALEALTGAVFLHNHVRDLFDPFIAREAFLARLVQTLAAATNDIALAALARVDHLVADIPAERTLHPISPLAIPPSFNPSCTMNSRPASATGPTEIACSTIAAPTAVSLSAPKNDVAPRRKAS